jgi:hypothetical protein
VGLLTGYGKYTLCWMVLCEWGSNADLWNRKINKTREEEARKERDNAERDGFGGGSYQDDEDEDML